MIGVGGYAGQEWTSYTRHDMAMLVATHRAAASGWRYVVRRSWATGQWLVMKRLPPERVR